MKNVLLKFSQNSEGNTCGDVSVGDSAKNVPTNIMNFLRITF